MDLTLVGAHKNMLKIQRLTRDALIQLIKILLNLIDSSIFLSEQWEKMNRSAIFLD